MIPAWLRIRTSARSPASMRATSIGRRAPGDNKPADAILLFEFPEQFLGGAAHADAAEDAEFGHRQRSLLHRFISRANDQVKQGPRPIWKISSPATAAFAPAFGGTNVLASMS